MFLLSHLLYIIIKKKNIKHLYIKQYLHDTLINNFIKYNEKYLKISSFSTLLGLLLKIQYYISLL